MGKFCCHCGTEIKEGAAVCIGCGRFLDSNKNKLEKQPKKNNSNTIWITILISLFVYNILMILFFTFVGVLFDDEPVYDVTPKELSEAFREDRDAALKKYEDKYIRVTGYVNTISSDMWGDYVIIEDESKFYTDDSATCYLDDKSKETIEDYEYKDEISVVGKAEHSYAGWRIKKCHIEEKE